MIAKSYILASLKFLDAKYRKTSSSKESLFYSKLAVLEFCGWIEESMDDIVLRCGRRHIKPGPDRKQLEKDIIDRTYGFDYEKHFRKMLIQTIGLINIQRLESRVDQVKKTLFISTLSSLKTMRDSEAHTHIKGATKKINAPSVTLSQFPAIYEGLIEYDHVIRATSY